MRNTRLAAGAELVAAVVGDVDAGGGQAVAAVGRWPGGVALAAGEDAAAVELAVERAAGAAAVSQPGRHHHAEHRGGQQRHQDRDEVDQMDRDHLLTRGERAGWWAGG